MRSLFAFFERDPWWFPVVAFYLTMAYYNSYQVFYPDSSALLLHELTMGMTSAFWVIKDARKRNKPILNIVQVFIFFSWLLAVPIYLVVSRGWYGLLLVFLNAFAIVLVSAGSAYGTYFLAISFLE